MLASMTIYEVGFQDIQSMKNGKSLTLKKCCMTTPNCCHFIAIAMLPL